MNDEEREREVGSFVGWIFGWIVGGLIMLLIILSVVRSYGADPDKGETWTVVRRFLCALDEDSVYPLAKAINDKATEEMQEMAKQGRIGGLPDDVTLRILEVKEKSKKVPVDYVVCQVRQGDKDVKKVYVFKLYFDPRAKHLKKE